MKETDPARIFIGELFRLWFLEYGTAYYFVFRKDASETNIQFAELLRLISREISPQPRYASHNEYRAALQQVIGDCFDTNDLTSEPKDIERFRHAYLPLIENTIVLDAFHGSAAVFIPPGRSIMPERVVGLSGYVHSAGRLVGIRDMQKATIEHFSHRYMRYVERYRSDTRYPPASIASIFSNESYSEDHSYYKLEETQQKAKLEFDRERRVNGLYGLMLSSAKCYLGGRLVKDAFKEILMHAQPQVTIHDPTLDGDSVELPSMLWLLCDGKLQSDMRKSSDKRYYVLYQQLWRNSNQFIVFDESMPAWKANETIPHSLVSAALNLAMPASTAWDPREPLSLIDPFVGSGTTILQSLKYGNIDGQGSDLSPLSDSLFRDNLKVASLSRDGVEELQKELDRILKKKVAFKSLVRRCRLVRDQEEGNDGDERQWLSLLNEQDTFALRLIVHLVRKCYRPFASDADLESAIINRALPALLVRLKKLADFAPEQGAVVETIPGCHLCMHAGSGLMHITISREHLENELRRNVARIAQRALTSTSDLQCFDLMVADPPYDFNVSNDQSYLLIQVLATKVAEKIKADGAIVVFLPDRSYTGKRLSPTVSSFAFIGQLLAAVGSSRELRLYNEVDRVPAPSVAFRGPFYWRAPRTLDRIALIFRFFRQRK